MQSCIQKKKMQVSVDYKLIYNYQDWQIHIQLDRGNTYMCETWVAAQPTLKTDANVLYPIVCRVDELVPRILQGIQPPKTDENETATKADPAPCHILKCPNLSIYQLSKQHRIISSSQDVAIIHLKESINAWKLEDDIDLG